MNTGDGLAFRTECTGMHRKTILGWISPWAGLSRRSLRFDPACSFDLERREVPAIVLPAGFTESVLVGGLSQPTSLEAVNDGRIFVSEAGGAIRIVENGTLLPEPFDTLPVANNGQGLIGITVDPKFASNHYVYAYYVADAGNGLYRNRLVRITADGDVAVPGSERVLLNLPPFALPPGQSVHDGASIHFGRDGKLYISTGDLEKGPLAQRLDNPFGKILRINSDGSIPKDNPFYNGCDPKKR